MIRIARVRRALRSRNYELVFGYTSGLDLIGHVSYNIPELQEKAYVELDEFVSEIRSDLKESDELVIISDHGLQDGIHTQDAFVSSSIPNFTDDINCVTDFRESVEEELENNVHLPKENSVKRSSTAADQKDVQKHLEDLGYM